jgi:signal transduction histidine kinase
VIGIPREAMLAGMSDGLLAVGADRKLAYANGSASRLLGIDVAARCGEDIDSVFAAIANETLDSEATSAAWQQAARRVEEHPRLELSFGGVPRRQVVAQLFPVAVDGGQAPEFGIELHEITAEREVLRARDELIAMIGHELASPASSLVSLADVLATFTQTESERREIHSLVLAEGHRLIKLIHDLKAIPHRESTSFKVAPRPVDPRRLLEHAIAVASLTSKDHPMSLALPEELPLVHADPARVQQVLANLISNAQKYSPDGAHVRVCARQVGDSIEVSVADEGLGIPQSARGRIFEKFFRIEASQRRLIPGTGLGLAICKEIVDAHGGQIGFESDDAGAGTRFWFTLPVAAALTPQIRHHLAAPIQRRVAAPGAGLRVLVVDDDPAIGKMVTLILQADAHRVVAVTSGEEALECLRVDRFDVVLSDLGIGAGIDGLELCALVRSGWPGVRFVLATGSVTVGPDDAQALGVDDLLTKPFRPTEVRRVIAAPGLHLRRTHAA